jgi:hypothetical protein
MTTAAWWAVGIAACILLARFWPGMVRQARQALGRRRQAEQRAEALLEGWLSAGQRAQYRSHGWFDVVTAAGHRYRVWPHKVVRLEPDARRSVYCIETLSWVPAADQMLAKKLLLETDERRFLATAHHYR